MILGRYNFYYAIVHGFHYCLDNFLLQYFIITYLALGTDVRALCPWDSWLWSNRISFVLRYGYHMF